MLAPRKVYANDLGVANLLKEQKIDHLMENIVYLELFINGIESRYYVIDKEEVDFVHKDNGEFKVIEVCYEVNENHIKKVEKAINRLGINEGIIITWDYEDEKELSWFGKKAKIKFIPLWKWLLNESKI